MFRAIKVKGQMSEYQWYGVCAKYSDIKIRTNSVDPDKTAKHVYQVLDCSQFRHRF